MSNELKAYRFGVSHDMKVNSEGEPVFEVATIETAEGVEVCFVDEQTFDAQVLLDTLNSRPTEPKTIPCNNCQGQGCPVCSGRGHLGEQIKKEGKKMDELRRLYQKRSGKLKKQYQERLDWLESAGLPPVPYDLFLESVIDDKNKEIATMFEAGN